METIFERYNMLMTQPFQQDLKTKIQGKHKSTLKAIKENNYIHATTLQQDS